MTDTYAQDGMKLSVAPGDDTVNVTVARTEDSLIEVTLSPRQAILLADAISRAVDTVITARAGTGPTDLWAEDRSFDIGNFGR